MKYAEWYRRQQARPSVDAAPDPAPATTPAELPVALFDEAQERRDQARAAMPDALADGDGEAAEEMTATERASVQAFLARQRYGARSPEYLRALEDMATYKSVSQLTSHNADNVRSVNSNKEPPMPEIAARQSEPEVEPPVSKKRTRLARSLPEKRLLLARAATSDLDLKTFCATAGIHPSLIFRWRREGIKPAASLEPEPAADEKPTAPRRPGARSPYSTEEQRFHVEQAWAYPGGPPAYAQDKGMGRTMLYTWRKKLGMAGAKTSSKRAPAAKVLARVSEESVSTPSRQAELESALEELRLENTVLKGTLQLAQRRGFDLFALDTELVRGRKGRS